MKKKQKFELKELNQGYWVAAKENIFIHSYIKEALIYRDPLTADLLKKFKDYYPIKNDNTSETNQLKLKIEEKWNVNILETATAKPHICGFKTTEEMQKACNTDHKPLIIGNKFRTEPVVGFNFPFESLMETSPNLLTIQINLDVINRNYLKFIKKAVCEITEKCLKRNNKKQKLPLGEIKELAKLYSLKEQTFNKYLKWYDLHMGEDLQKIAGLRFREIAKVNLCELIERKCPKKLEDIKSAIEKGNIKNLDKKSQKIIKEYTGESIEWEDAVEKAVKLIWEVIHRKPYPAKKPKELFNCPDHGKNCPIDCPNLNESRRIFNNRFKLRRLYTQHDMSHFEDPQGEKTPAKGKSQKIIGLQKIQEEDF